MIEFENDMEWIANIKVVGIGGGGCNAVNRMIANKLSGVEFIAVNTDKQALKSSLAAHKIQVGSKLTKGLGSGSNPEVGRRSLEDDKEKIADVLQGADMVFVTAGMGGGTGTGGAPIIAEIAKQQNALVVAVVTKPFLFEGYKRMLHADQGIKELVSRVDTLIAIPNQKLLAIVDKQTPVRESFNIADNVLDNAVHGIADIITQPGLINVDFADVRTIMSEMGGALMGTGYGTGEGKAVKAAQQAISSPLLDEISIDGAHGVLFNITGGPDMTLHEVNEAASVIYERAHKEAHIIVGAVIDESLYDEVKITVIATGFNLKEEVKPKEDKLPDFLKLDRILPRREYTSIISSEREMPKIYGSDSLDIPTFLRRGEVPKAK
ncbi:MAG: cell division protein FtsZ [Candidatus Firestonebacteria bacterium]